MRTRILSEINRESFGFFLQKRPQEPNSSSVKAKKLRKAVQASNNMTESDYERMFIPYVLSVIDYSGRYLDCAFSVYTQTVVYTQSDKRRMIDLAFQL